MDCPCPEHSPDSPPPTDARAAVIGEINGHPVVSLRRLTNGQVMCQLCFGYFWPCELNIIDVATQAREDACVACALSERRSAPGPG